jgi:cholera toxin transcriptional activator
LEQARRYFSAGTRGREVVRIGGKISNATLRPESGGRVAGFMAEKKTITFGIFELDLVAGELRKGGVKLRLQGQPFQVLVVLLERAGEIVTREELRQSLWPSDTFVDFDHSLNTAINKVRDTLGDSAASPRYIETLARRGYRFIAPVERSEPATKKIESGAERDLQPAAAIRQESQPALHPELEIPFPNRAIPRTLFVLIQVMYLAFYLTALFRLRAIETFADSFLQYRSASVLVGVLIVSAGIGIPLRCYLISAVAFDYQRLGETFKRIFPLVLALDELWAIAPFLLTQRIGWGGAFAVSAALLYLPFSERTLIKMAYVRK